MATTERRPLRDASMRVLLEETLESARDLASDEARMILAEASEEGARAKRIGAYAGTAASIGTAGVAWVGMAVLLAAGAAWWVILLVGLIAIGLAGGLAYAAWKLVPDVTFARARERIEQRARRLAAAASETPALGPTGGRPPES